jgi:hypothetical protein
MTKKPILCLDFDGVIHSYASGWRGATHIPDPPVPGALEFLSKAVHVFDVQIHSSRSHWAGGISAMKAWLAHHAMTGAAGSIGVPEWLDLIGWPAEKPPAFVTLDDRAITFTGTWPDLDDLKNFKPWWSKLSTVP